MSKKPPFKATDTLQSIKHTHQPSNGELRLFIDDFAQAIDLGENIRHRLSEAFDIERLFHISENELKILIIIFKKSDQTPLRTVDLCELAYSSETSVRTIIRSLKHKGLVKEERRPGKRNSLSYRTTELGRKLLNKLSEDGVITQWPFETRRKKYEGLFLPTQCLTPERVTKENTIGNINEITQINAMLWMIENIDMQEVLRDRLLQVFESVELVYLHHKEIDILNDVNQSKPPKGVTAVDCWKEGTNINIHRKRVRRLIEFNLVEYTGNNDRRHRLFKISKKGQRALITLDRIKRIKERDKVKPSEEAGISDNVLILLPERHIQSAA